VPSIDIGLDEKTQELWAEIRAELHKAGNLLADANEMNLDAKRLLLEIVRKLRKASGLHCHVARRARESTARSSSLSCHCISKR
jgi:hypothetical protein